MKVLQFIAWMNYINNVHVTDREAMSFAIEKILNNNTENGSNTPSTTSTR